MSQELHYQEIIETVWYWYTGRQAGQWAERELRNRPIHL